MFPNVYSCFNNSCEILARFSKSIFRFGTVFATFDFLHFSLSCDVFYRLSREAFDVS